MFKDRAFTQGVDYWHTYTLVFRNGDTEVGRHDLWTEAANGTPAPAIGVAWPSPLIEESLLLPMLSLNFTLAALTWTAEHPTADADAEFPLDGSTYWLFVRDDGTEVMSGTLDGVGEGNFYWPNKQAAYDYLDDVPARYYRRFQEFQAMILRANVGFLTDPRATMDGMQEQLGIWEDEDNDN